ncbi:MAG: PP2C family protein-serine/threonine phosphatase [Candidatus Gracilibacteria bacterium]|nr:PP2C family protein-serine/threonine phosphatase [Candidatus Gracilibacteria bacterium]
MLNGVGVKSFFSGMFHKNIKEEKKEIINKNNYDFDVLYKEIVDLVGKKDFDKVQGLINDLKIKEDKNLVELLDRTDDTQRKVLIRNTHVRRLGIITEIESQLKNNLSSNNNLVIQNKTENVIKLGVEKTNITENIVTNTISSEKKEESQENINIEQNEEVKKGFFAKLFGKKSLKEKIDIQKVVDFDGAIRSIKFFIDIKDWENAKFGISEIRKKEEGAFYSLIDKIDLEREKKKQRSIYEKKFKKIKDLEEYLNNMEFKYNEKRKTEKFKIKFVQVRKELDEFIGSKRFPEAMDLINNFFEENSTNVLVIRFFNKWKAIIQNKIKKQEKERERKLSKNYKKEAELLIGDKIEVDNTQVDEGKKKVKHNFFKFLFNKVNVYKNIKNKLREKKLLDEVNLLLETQNEVSELTKKSKIENMHMGLIKEISNDRLIGYELYAKILGKDKISGDTLGFSEDEATYKFFLGDATGHGIQAGLIVTLITRLFYNLSKNNFLEKLVFDINNGIKQDLKSGNFITGLFFELDKANLNHLKYVGMGHEPILVFRKKTREVEKYLSGGLAAGIRIINDINQIKVRDLTLDDGDIVIIYSDGIVESRNMDNELLGINGLMNIIKKVVIRSDNINTIYANILDEVKAFRGGNLNFFDDATIFMLKRNSEKDLVVKGSSFLKDLSLKEGLTRKNMKALEGKTKEEIEHELVRIRRDKQLKLILSTLDNLYVTGEILKLKQESVRYLKEGFIHKKINNYLKKAIASEKKYKIDLKEQKMKSKYAVLSELLKKGDYMTVIKECNEVIASDGNINI